MNMNRINYITIIVTIIVIITIGLVSLHQSSDLNYVEKPRVVVTILPQEEFIEKIAGDKVSITTMVPPGASPHTYEPRPSQMKEITEAEMYAKVGSGLDFELVWMPKIIETNPNMLIIDSSKGIKLIETIADNENGEHETNEREHARKDPHFWLSPKNVIIMVENLYEGLVKIDPDNKRFYTENKDAYIESLKELDSTIMQTFSGLKTKKFMVYHDSWDYLAYDYGLEQIPIQKEGKEPTPEGIANLIDQARENNITIIFASPEFEIQTAKTIAEEIDGSVILISPLAKDYIENLKRMSDEISKSLNE
ncbi:zinc ABC transporter substrate-binding protein [Candidatus Bathyarchaeota archaeon]|nr:zinc ABC transporter substrate-binding protein [Candidatus Bathyarchaeota archaeon]